MISVDEINKLQTENKRLNDIIDSYQPRLEELKELKAENELLKIENKLIRQMHKDLSDKLFGFQKTEDVLQEIKAIVEELLEKGLEPQSVEHQLKLRGKRELASIILDLITKAEEE